VKEIHQFEKAFGPGASFSGKILFIVGLCVSYYTLTGLILVLIGAFLGFTNSCTTIDFDGRRIKYSNNLFGFIKTGKWQNITKEMQTGISKSKHIYRTNSQSNKSIDIETENTVIWLFDSEGKKVVPLKRVISIEKSENELDELSHKLGLLSIKQ
jgi:hypothetical protein